VLEGELGDLNMLGDVDVAPEGLGVEVGVVGGGDSVVAAGGLDLGGVDDGVDLTDSSSSDLSAAAPSDVHV
jgi:hypothetical protein